MSLLPFLHRVSQGENLNSLDARLAMGTILSGEATPAQIGAFLTALKMKGETVDEVVGFARAMRRVANHVEPELGDKPLVDTCGTGGDGGSTFNISTLAAFVVAGAGVAVAKHGNRSLSSQCGAADLMEALGVKLTFDPDQMARAIREIGIAFLFAPAVHSSMKFAQPVRAELKMRTVFNLLGPLTNPADANVQIVGAPSEKTAELMAFALSALGLPRGYVVHGTDGLDEITTTGPTIAFEITSSKVLRRMLHPDDFGLYATKASELRGGDRDTNLAIAKRVLLGEKGPKRDIVLANASAALFAAGRAANLVEGVQVAAHSIDSGAARRKMEALVEFSRKG
jgi:anthranilate phosphoribosyltransferase